MLVHALVLLLPPCAAPHAIGGHASFSLIWGGIHCSLMVPSESWVMENAFSPCLIYICSLTCIWGNTVTGKSNSHPAFSQLLAVIVCWETFTNGCASLKACRIISLLDCSEQLVTPKFQAAHMGLSYSFCPTSVWSTQAVPSPKWRLQEEASSIQLLGPHGCFVVHYLYAPSHLVSLYSFYPFTKL